jgi:hypothetical protein
MLSGVVFANTTHARTVRRTDAPLCAAIRRVVRAEGPVRHSRAKFRPVDLIPKACEWLLSRMISDR